MAKSFKYIPLFLIAVLILRTAFLIKEKERFWWLHTPIASWEVAEEENIPMNDNSSHSLSEILSQVDTKTLRGDQAKRYLLASLSWCWVPELYRTPTVISDVVQNCQRKEKQWSFHDGLWGVFLNSYGYDTTHKKVISMTENFWINENGDVWVDSHAPLCVNFFNGFPELAYSIIENWKFVDEMAEWFFSYSWAAYALEKGLSKEYLRLMNHVYDEWQLYINPNDQDLAINYSAGAYSDEEWNYFLAGFNFDGKLYYQINDILFDPGENTEDYDKNLWTPNYKWNSLRFFWGFKDWKIIVNRFLDYHYLWNRISLWEQCYNDGNCVEIQRNASEFTLETCEIDTTTLNLNY